MTMREPFFSIVTPTFNRACYILECVSSALAQDYSNYEIVIVDDGSTDATAEIVKSLGNPLLRYVVKEHSGAPDTRNHCIRNARGEYLIWLDSDDVMLPGVLKHYANILEQLPGLDIIYSDLDVFSTPGSTGKMEFPDYHNVPDLLPRVIRGNLLPNPGTLVRKSLYQNHGNYNIQFHRAHDFELWSRVVHKAKVKHSGITAIRYRCHGDNMSVGNFDKSYEAGVIKRLCHRHGLKKLFPALNWNEPELAAANALKTIGNLLASCNDVDNAMKAYRHALLTADKNTTAELLLFAMDALALQTELSDVRESGDEAQQWRIGKGYVEPLEIQKLSSVSEGSSANHEDSGKWLQVSKEGYFFEGTENAQHNRAHRRLNLSILRDLIGKETTEFKHQYEKIEIGDVLACVPDLEATMNSLLSLLKPGGEIIATVPYMLSNAAWSNPGYVRCFSENSWSSYTQCSRTHFEAFYSDAGKELQKRGVPFEDILAQPRAVDSMRVVLQKV